MNTQKLLIQAKNKKYALGAFNTANIEGLIAITNAAYKLKSPIILEASEGEVNYIGVKQLAALVQVYREKIGVPIILNLDHAKTFEACKEAIDAGFNYVHLDGSKLPLEENIKVTKKVVEYAHAQNPKVLVEGEMDHIQGSSADHTREDPNLYDKPEYFTKAHAAKDFVSQTKIDVFASFIGNLHGVFSKETRLKFNILEELKKELPNTFLSLHGGSGTNKEDIKKAIDMGVVKVNVNSEMRMAFKKTLQKALNETDEIAIYKITPSAIEAVQKVVEEKIMLFGSSNFEEEIETIV